MVRKKILFRADGNSITGLGHLYRLFALIEIYKDQFEYILLTKEDSSVSVIPNKYSYTTIPKEIDVLEEPEWLYKRYGSEDYIIIADGYQFDIIYQKRIKSFGFFLMYIDDKVLEGTTANIVLNHAENVYPSDYKFSEVETFALGARYAILRPAFLKASKENTRGLTDIESVFICFGGADPKDLTLKAVKGLLEIEEIMQIHVVLGGAYTHSEIFKLSTTNTRVHTYQNLDENSLCKLMQDCDFAIAPASTVLYELCSVGIPVLSGYFVENQKNIYEALSEKKVIYEGGDFTTYNSKDFTQKAQEILDRKNYKEYLKNQQQVFDGNSDRRLIKSLNEAFITFRQATEADVHKTYIWSNDDLVRQNSYHSDKIAFEEHQEWFFSKLENENTLFLVGQFFDVDAAVIRIEKQDESAIIGISILKDYRGKNLGTSFLIKSAKYYFKQNSLPILAYIKVGNIPSIKSFEGAGFKFYKKEIIQGAPSVVYKLTKDDLFR